MEAKFCRQSTRVRTLRHCSSFLPHATFFICPIYPVLTQNLTMDAHKEMQQSVTPLVLFASQWGRHTTVGASLFEAAHVVDQRIRKPLPFRVGLRHVAGPNPKHAQKVKVKGLSAGAIAS